MSKSQSQIHQWIINVFRALQNREKPRLGVLFSPLGLIAQNEDNAAHKPGREKIPAEEFENLNKYRIEQLVGSLPFASTNIFGTVEDYSNFGKVMIHYLLAMKATASRKWTVALESVVSIFDICVEFCRDEDEFRASFFVTLLSALCEYIIELANLADSESWQSVDYGDTLDDDDDQFKGGMSSNTVQLEKTLNCMRKHIGKFRTGSGVSHPAYIVLLAESIHACILLKNVQMAVSFLKSTEADQKIDPRTPKGHATKFQYYLGILQIQREEYSRAETPLVTALTLCPRSRSDLRSSIFACLVAVRLRLGCCPSVKLLSEQKLLHYSGVIKAVCTGNIGLFDKSIREHERQFAKEGTLLALERSKPLLYRVLIQKTHNWALNSSPGLLSQAYVVPVDLLTAAFKWQYGKYDPLTALGDCEDVEFDDEEMCCVLANLIRLHLVRGYIAWERGKLVLSKLNAFPEFKSITF